MKIGVNLLLWCGGFSDENIPLIERVAALGYDGVELPVFAPQNVTANSVKKALDNTGMGCNICSVMPPDSSVIAPDAEARQRGVDYLKTMVELAEGIGAEVICGPNYSPVGHLVGRGRTDEEWRWCVDSLQQVAPVAESAGVRFALEPLNRFETYFLNTASDAHRMASDVGSSAFGVHFDTFHANIEEKQPVESLKSLGDRLYHFHASENDRGPVGTGHVDWDGMAKTLKDMGYDGWIVLESFHSAIEEIAAAASIWRAFAPSSDDLATESLAFLRKFVA